ncbi:MAG: (2Fe-2S)-binding protein [Acidimicrobiia bacterium]
MVDLVVNGVRRSVEVAPGCTLLEFLRDTLGLTGTKDACGRGECGACTVLVDGDPVMSCVTLVATVTGDVTTIEGLGESAERLREAFADQGAFQCGYCTSGQIVRGVSLLSGPVLVDEEALRRAISGNICRCTGYDPIVQALRSTATSIQGTQ